MLRLLVFFLDGAVAAAAAEARRGAVKAAGAERKLTNLESYY